MGIRVFIIIFYIITLVGTRVSIQYPTMITVKIRVIPGIRISESGPKSIDNSQSTIILKNNSNPPISTFNRSDVAYLKGSTKYFSMEDINTTSLSILKNYR